MTKLNTRLVSSSLFALFMAAGASQVSAQQATQPQTTQPQATQAAPAMQASEISDKKLEKFADSLGEIMEIREDFTAKLEQTGDPAEAQQLQQQANQKMMETVENNDLSIEEYNAINQAVQNNPQLRDKVISMIQS